MVTDERPIVIPIDGALDLHTFDPRDIGDLVPEYLRACRAQGIYEVRIVHGKGRGALRRSVHAVLAGLDEVVEYRSGGAGEGEWGATIVRLRPQKGE